MIAVSFADLYRLRRKIDQALQMARADRDMVAVCDHLDAAWREVDQKIRRLLAAMKKLRKRGEKRK